MSDLPLVTVGMPLYNGAAYLREAISDVLADGYANWELILLDDGSKDDSLEIASSFSDPRIRVLRNDVNQGLVAARNRILDEAQGTFIAWLDQDDLSYPGRLGSQVAYLQAHPHVGICGSWSNLITHGTDGRLPALREKLPVSHADIRAQMLFSNPIKCNTVMMRASSLAENHLRFRPEFGNALDYDLWARASELVGIHNLPQILAGYRIHASQTSRGHELEKINQSGLQVQRELMLRSVGIEMSPSQLAIQTRLTLAPESISTESALLETADWLREIRGANGTAQAFESAALDRALARQWITALVGASRSGMSRTASMSIGRKGARAMGLPNAAVGQQIAIGIARIAERKLPESLIRSIRR